MGTLGKDTVEKMSNCSGKVEGTYFFESLPKNMFERTDQYPSTETYFNINCIFERLMLVKLSEVAHINAMRMKHLG